MPIEDRDDAHVITHALAKHTISELRPNSTRPSRNDTWPVSADRSSEMVCFASACVIT